MKILLDEMYAGLKEYLEALDYEVVTCQEAGLAGAKDREVVEYASEQKLILVTQDQKTSELADLFGVRNVFVSSLLIAQLIDQEIKQFQP